MGTNFLLSPCFHCARGEGLEKVRSLTVSVLALYPEDRGRTNTSLSKRSTLPTPFHNVFTFLPSRCELAPCPPSAIGLSHGGSPTLHACLDSVAAGWLRPLNPAMLPGQNILADTRSREHVREITSQPRIEVESNNWNST